MKIGIRKPSLKKSFKARTTGKVKRKMKRAINPLYGKKGMGWVNNPKRAAYNKVYNKITIGAKDITKGLMGNSSINNKNSRSIRKEESWNGLRYILLFLTFPFWFPFCCIYVISKYTYRLIIYLLRNLR